MNSEYEYCHLDRFSREVGVLEEDLVKALEIERGFHTKILVERDRRRKQMYEEVCERVHATCGESSNAIIAQNPKDRTARLFRKELEGESILDVGCGEGRFLIIVANQLEHKGPVVKHASTSVLPEKQAYSVHQRRCC